MSFFDRAKSALVPGEGEPATVARWAVISSFLAPVILVGGWLAAGAEQPPGYSPIKQSISTLAGDGGTDPWFMAICMVAVGCCHLLTAAGLRPIRPMARIVLAIGACAGIALACFPDPVGYSSAGHLTCATIGAVALTLWPALVGSHEFEWPSVLSVRGALTASVVFTVLTGWLLIEAINGPAFGLAERICTAAESMWPFVIVMLLIRAESRVSVLPAPTPAGSADNTVS